MQVNIKIRGLEEAKKQLEGMRRKVDPVMRGALNTTATQARQKVYIRQLGVLFYDKQELRRRLVIKRAGKNRNDSRIIPSSSGIPVVDWPGWRYSVVAPTRGVIYVRGLNGRKVAAGFVNPASKGRFPLRSKGFKGAGLRAKGTRRRVYKGAIGPSIAYFFRQLTNAESFRFINEFLQEEFAKRMNKEIAKGARA